MAFGKCEISEIKTRIVHVVVKLSN